MKFQYWHSSDIKINRNCDMSLFTHITNSKQWPLCANVQLLCLNVALLYLNVNCFMSKNFPINLLAGEDYLPTFMWNLIHYSPSTNNTIIDLSKKKKSCNFGRPWIIGSRFVRFLIGLVVSALATVYNKIMDNFQRRCSGRG